MKMFKFFKKEKKYKNIQKPSFEFELTASVLAYEIARSDGEISDNELSLLMEEIKKISDKVGRDKQEIIKREDLIKNMLASNKLPLN